MNKKLARLGKEMAWLKRDRPDYYAQGIKRLKTGEPLDYVIGWREFLGCKIDLSEKPLIPREETEFWTEIAISELKAQSAKRKTKTQNLKALDIFSGSGCVGIAVLKHCSNIQMTFGEKEEKFVKQIKKNLKINKLTGRVPRSDVFSNIEGKFGYIFANPPYIPTKKSTVQKSVKSYEPEQALWGGENGLFFINKFLSEAKNYLNPEGRIFMEFGYGQKGSIEKLLKKYDYKNWQFKKDQFGRWRFVVIE